MKTFKSMITSIIIIAIVAVGSYKVCYTLTTIGIKFASKLVEQMKKYMFYIKKYFSRSKVDEEMEIESA